MPTKKKQVNSPQKAKNLMLWKASAIVFTSSFCVMVIEILAARILAPHIGVSLYTWTTIIGVILAGIALGNYVGGKIADKRPSPLILVAIFFVGGLLTIAVTPLARAVGNANWSNTMPIMLSFTLQTSCIFLLPAFILSMVSPLVIKLTLADLGQTGGVVGTIYAISTAGSILGTFLTGFFFILLFGIRMLVLLVGGVLILTGILSLFAWKMPNRWKLSFRNISLWIATIIVLLAYGLAFNPSKQERLYKERVYSKETNYFFIQIVPSPDDNNIQVMSLDHLIHSYVDPINPFYLKYDYLKMFSDVVSYVSVGNEAPKTLHLGGGGYSFPRYLEVKYPKSVNDVVEIDPMVTLAAQEKMGLIPETSIKTYNLDARLFLKERIPEDKYDFVIGDVFNDFATPYHLTTLEFDRLVKANMKENGVYLINTIDNFQRGRYLLSLIYTLEQVFEHVYLMGKSENIEAVGTTTFVIAATDMDINISEYSKFITEGGKTASGYVYDELKVKTQMAARKPVLLTDDYAPTDILLAPLVREGAKR